MARTAFVVPGDLVSATGGFAYDRRMVQALASAGRLLDLLCLQGTFPFPRSDTVDVARRWLLTLPDQAFVVCDGLAYTPLHDAFRTSHGRVHVIALVHHLLGDETGLNAADAESLLRQERAVLAECRHVIVTSPATARRLKELGISHQAITVVEPGVTVPPGNHTAGWRRARTASPVRLLAVGALVPRKGQDVLIRALSGLRSVPWQLDVVGPPRDPQFAALLRGLISAHRMEERIRLTGEVADSRLDALYRAADVFVLPSHHEGYGIAFAEAVAHGLPVIATAAGAAGETVPRHAGILVPPGDVAALRRVLCQVCTDPYRRRRLTQGAVEASRHSRTWQTAQAQFLSVLDRVIRP